MSDKNSTVVIKRDRIKQILFRIIDKNLRLLYEKVKTEQVGGKHNKFVNILNKMPNLDNYEIQNNREVCETHKSKDQCIKSFHCHFAYDECHLGLTRDLVIVFVNKVSDELVSNEHKASEILKTNNYFVSDIVDYNRFHERDNQKIIKSSNNTINRVLFDLFGSSNIPNIGKRNFRHVDKDEEIIMDDNLIHVMGTYSTQKIIENNLSVIRAYANGYTWLKHTYYETENKNLGYFSNLQTDVSNYFRSNIIDWITDKNNYTEIVQDLEKYMDTKKKNFIQEYINKLSKNGASMSGVIEYYILNKIHKIPIIVYDKNDEIIYIIDSGIKYDKTSKSKIDEKYLDESKLKNYINIKFTSTTSNMVPINIDVIYFA